MLWRDTSGSAKSGVTHDGGVVHAMRVTSSIDSEPRISARSTPSRHREVVMLSRGFFQADVHPATGMPPAVDVAPARHRRRVHGFTHAIRRGHCVGPRKEKLEVPVVRPNVRRKPPLPPMKLVLGDAVVARRLVLELTLHAVGRVAMACKPPKVPAKLAVPLERVVVLGVRAPMRVLSSTQ